MKIVLAGILVAAVGCSKGGGGPSGPRANCDAVAEAMVSSELGNYASREERAAALPAQRARCEQLKLTVKEGECLAKATDKWSSAECVPRMYPEVEIGGCGPVVAKLTSLLGGAMGSDPSMKPMMDKMMGVIRQSCSEDHWPPALRACIMDTKDLAGFSACEKVTPPELKTKLEQRIQSVM